MYNKKMTPETVAIITALLSLIASAITGILSLRERRANANEKESSALLNTSEAYSNLATDLRAEIAALRERTRALEKENADKEERIATLNGRITSLEGEAAEQSRVISLLRRQNADLRELLELNGVNIPKSLLETDGGELL